MLSRGSPEGSPIGFEGASLKTPTASVIKINTASKFYTDLYGHDKTTPRQRHALNLLIGAMAATEAKSSEEGKRWYERARGQWTERLNTFLDMLNEVQFPESEVDFHTYENETAGIPVEEVED